MKISISTRAFPYVFILMLLCFSQKSSALPEMKVTYHVTDSENGLPITNAVVTKCFILGSGYDGASTKQETAKVDRNGFCVISGETHRHAGGGAGAQAEGYYYGSAELNFSGRNIMLNRWEPWNPTVEIKIRKIKNPVPMVKKYIEWKSIPYIGSAVGYDLEVGDWVSPHGKGKISDLILTTSSYFQEGQKGSEARYTLSFPNEFDGIQVYRYPEELHSSFKWPYQAPMDGYQPTLEKFRHWDVNGMPDKSNYAEKNNYMFRVRSRKLEDGSMEACYGMIEGEIEYIPQGKIRFSYWFTPVPNERSLEWNGVNLLKKK